MNIDKDGLEQLQKKFNNLTETSKKYAEQGYVKSTNIDFRSPENEDEEMFVKKVNNKAFLFLLLFSLIFIVTAVYSFISKVKIIVPIFSLLIAIYSGYLAFKARRNTELFIGKAVYKERVRKTGSGKRIYNYYVSVANDYTKEIYTRIRISESDYLRVEEGTPILISKGASKAFIYENK